MVENRAGANGVIGTEVVARAPGDGHTLLFTATGHFTNEPMMPRLPFDTARDFKPVAKLASVAAQAGERRRWAELIRASGAKLE